jgi:hypothetical protein
MNGSISLSASTRKAQVPSRKQCNFTRNRSPITEHRQPFIRILSAHKYVSPRQRPLTPEEQEVRRIAYALKIPTHETCELAARDLAPLLDAACPQCCAQRCRRAESPATDIVLMPVPASTGSIDANRHLANAIAAELRRQACQSGTSGRRQACHAEASDRRRARTVQVKVTVGRQHPVESSCLRRKRRLPGLAIEDHAMIRVAAPLPFFATAYYFVDNMATTGSTLSACRAALGFGDAIVWADQGICPR